MVLLCYCCCFDDNTEEVTLPSVQNPAFLKQRSNTKSGTHHHMMVQITFIHEDAKGMILLFDMVCEIVLLEYKCIVLIIHCYCCQKSGEYHFILLCARGFLNTKNGFGRLRTAVGDSSAVYNYAIWMCKFSLVDIFCTNLTIKQWQIINLLQ